jgi:2-polyprenyl-3-methyl-5-hydroxy-6-metoxy-1,4-benzoquinol methylase
METGMGEIVMTSTLEQRIKQYWNNQPCNIRHSGNEIGSLDFFKEVSARRSQVEPHIPEFAGFHLWQGKQVLEIGPGIGSDAAEFARHGADYYGIDYSEESVKLARKRFEVEELAGNFYCGDAGDAAVYNNLPQFDLIYSYGVIHHFPAIDKIINNVHQALKPGGEFRFMVYARDSWKQAMINKGLDQYEAQAGCPYAKSYTKDDIAVLLGSQFHIERLRQDHCFMYNVQAYKQGRYELEPWFEAMPAAMREAVREYLGWHLLVKARKI